MSWRKTLKLVHFTGAAWFMVCVSCTLILALRQAGFHWWVIFSLSGHSALLTFLLISLYLFAIFRGIDRSREIEVEQPLTSTSYYAVFYDVSPFLGGLGGYLGTIGTTRADELLLGITLGTLVTTFLVWIVVDPVIGFVERLLPASRKHRLERLAQIRALRQKRQEERKRLLAEILAQEEQNRRHWRQVLQPYAEKLVRLLSKQKIGDKQTENEAVNIGASAWQIGGLSCMRELHKMTMEICNKRYQNSMIIDYISTWWDGIGSWRNPSLG